MVAVRVVCSPRREIVMRWLRCVDVWLYDNNLPLAWRNDIIYSSAIRLGIWLPYFLHFFCWLGNVRSSIDLYFVPLRRYCATAELGYGNNNFIFLCFCWECLWNFDVAYSVFNFMVWWLLCARVWRLMLGVY